MDFDDTPEEAAWRAGVRAFLKQHRGKGGDRDTETARAWQATLYDAGFVGVTWPVEVIQVHGGIGFTWEHDAHLYWRRSKVDRLLLGDDVSAYDEVARLAVAR